MFCSCLPLSHSLICLLPEVRGRSTSTCCCDASHGHARICDTIDRLWPKFSPAHQPAVGDGGGMWTCSLKPSLCKRPAWNRIRLLVLTRLNGMCFFDGPPLLPLDAPYIGEVNGTSKTGSNDLR